MGPTARTGESTEGLVSFGDRFYYSDPRFSWAEPVAPTVVQLFGPTNAAVALPEFCTVNEITVPAGAFANPVPLFTFTCPVSV